MTDLDSIIEQANIDRPAPVASTLPKRPGIWRVVSLLAVVAAVIISALAVLQARDASNVAAPERTPVALEETTVTVVDLVVPPSAEISVLGLPYADSGTPFEAAGTTIDLPRDQAAVIGLTNADREIVGLAVVPIDGDRSSVAITPRSTASALLFLSPGVLRADVATAFAQLEAIEVEPAFDVMVRAVRDNSNITNNNESLERAFAEIADRIPAPQPVADQGCDSVLDSNAYASAGTCVMPRTTGLVVTNEQDRWALVFSGEAGYERLCAVVSPRNIDGDEVLLSIEQCVGDALMVAPGRVVNQGTEQPVIDQRIRTAVALNMLYDYSGPFADLVGASAGYSSRSVGHIRANSAEIVQTLALLEQTNEQFSAAMEVALMASTALDRHTAAVSSTQLLIDTADTTAIIPERSPGDTSHLDILDFYQRAGERMTGERTDWRWDATASGTIAFGGDA